MSVQLIEAKYVPTPCEVIVHSQGNGGRLFRALIFEKILDNQRCGYQENAVGEDCSGRRISLAPNTKVELARPIVF